MADTNDVVNVCSNKREPLGKGYVRGHQFPGGLGTERPFGCVYDAIVSSSDGRGRARAALQRP